MRKAPKIAAVSAGVLLVLAGCGTTGSNTSTPGTQAPATTAPAPSTTPSTTAPSATASVLNQTEQADLVYIHEEERVGYNAYQVFASRYSQPVFANLTDSQATQVSTVTGMMSYYKVADTSASLAPGKFSDTTLQTLYNDTINKATSAEHALDAMKDFEEQNLTDLQKAASHTSRADLVRMYTNLEQASRAHISACDNALSAY